MQGGGTAEAARLRRAQRASSSLVLRWCCAVAAWFERAARTAAGRAPVRGELPAAEREHVSWRAQGDADSAGVGAKAAAGGAVRESARRTYSATTLPFSASLAFTFSPFLFSSVVVATSRSAIFVGARASASWLGSNPATLLQLLLWYLTVLA